MMYSKIGIEGYRVLECERKHKGVLVHLEVKEKPRKCPCCGGLGLHSKGRYLRRAKHLECFGDDSELHVRCRRYQCLSCRKSFVQPLPGILPYRRSTEPFREEVYKRHEDGICGSRLAEIKRIGAATVERIYHQFTERKAKERISRECPEVLGIDEHTLHKGNRFATTFCDLKNHRVFDVVPGRCEADLKSFLNRLKGRKKVKVVCIDLSSPYRSMIRRYFPNARIVADRFHVIRIVQQHFIQLARQIDPKLKNHRGKLACLRKTPSKLDNKQRLRRDLFFAEHPAIKALYEQMWKLIELMNVRTQSARACRGHARRLMQYIDQLKDSRFDAMNTLAKTLSQWAEPIACMWRFYKNNGITEGFHRKMKLIQRRAYGFRNFNNYRLRVIAQCG